MFKIAVIIFRESLEIAILLGIILAITKHIKNSRTYIILGIVIGVVLASIFAFFTRSVSIMFGGIGDEIFDSCIILLTALIISWTVVWMQGYTKKIKKNLGEMADKITSGTASHFMLVGMVASIILREGTEIILFIYSISSTEDIEATSYIIGLGIGSLCGLIIGTVLYLGLIKFAGKYVFRLSTVLLILIAAGLSAEAAGILTSSGIIEPFSDQLWDSAWLIEDRSMTGKVLNIIAGYHSRPNGMQIIFYLSTILLTIGMIKVKSMTKHKKNA